MARKPASKSKTKPASRQFPATIYVQYDDLEYDPTDPDTEPDEDVCLLADRDIPDDMPDGQRFAVYRLEEVGELRVTRELVTEKA